MASLKVLNGQNPREIAIEALSHRGPNEYLEDALERALTQNPLRPKDRALCQEMVYGITRNQSALDWLISRKTGGRDQKPVLRQILRLGLYQIFWTDRIPSHAAVNETVELAKLRGFGPQSGFINAILRGYLREADATKAALAALKKIEPWTACSHPEWLVRSWIARWGLEKALALLDWNNTPPATCARVNALKAGPGKLLETWRAENVEYDFLRGDWFVENAIFRLKEHPPLHKLGSFAQGMFYIQDPSTLLAVAELEAAPGQAVLDMCAAPGGKLACIAQVMRGEGRLVGRDVSEARLALARENCLRLGVGNVELQLADAARPEQEPFDRVLLDAPCSNTGVMRRRIDLRWRIKPEELRRLRNTQMDLLREGAGQTKPGGKLVYSTCSIEPEENGELVREFLAGQKEFELQSERTLLPFIEGVDGAYVARLARNAL
jgi:16S rRNA (cytosine967-C5)-methyltransferase